jgi:signal transduction histidine kinase
MDSQRLSIGGKRVYFSPPHVVTLESNPNLLDETISGQFGVLSLLFSSIFGHFGYVGLALDRSMHRKLKTVAERPKDEEALRRGEQITHLDRQRSLGQLSASLGHEMNQPLTAILMNAQVTERGLTTGQFKAFQLAEFFDKIALNTERATQIIERIRNFIRPSQNFNAPVDLNRVVTDVVKLVAGEVPHI